MERDFLEELMASQQAPKRKKRRGLAGIWDRNKNIITPLATGAVGLIPGVGPMAAAGLGAAMRGLDRPGKGGVGLDVGQAVRGGLEGYGAGAAASALKGGAQAAMGAKGLGRLSAFGSGAKAGAEEYMRKPLLGRGTTESAGNVQRVASPMGGSVEVGRLAEGYTPGSAPMARRGLAMGRLGRGLGASASRVLQFIRTNPEVAEMGFQALSGIMGSQAERRMREREMAEERRRAQNQAMFALPMYLESMRGSR